MFTDTVTASIENIQLDGEHTLEELCRDITGAIIEAAEVTIPKTKANKKHKAKTVPCLNTNC